MKRSFFLTLILVLGLGAFLAGCAGSDGDPEDRITPPIIRTEPDKIPPCTTGALCVTGDETEVCNDLTDNDSDGLVDCADTADCFNYAACVIERGGDCPEGNCYGDEPPPPDPPAEDDPPSDVKITAPEDDVVKFAPQLYGVPIPNGERTQFTVKGGSGSYSWTFEEVPLTDLGEYCADCSRNGRNKAPVGIRFSHPVPGDVPGMESIKIKGVPRDTLGKYVFKVKVTDTSTGQPTSGHFYTKVVKFHIADKIEIKVYKLNAGGTQWVQINSSTGTGSGFEDESHGEDYNNIVVANGGGNFIVPANQALKIEADGIRDDLKWGLSRHGADFGENDSDLENASIRLTRRLPEGFVDATSPSFRNAMVNSSPTRVRYLSAKRDFSYAGDENLVKVKDGKGNFARLRFESLDFKCKGELKLDYVDVPGGGEVPGLVYGNIGKTVSRSLRASGGSGDYEWKKVGGVVNRVGGDIEKLFSTNLVESSGSSDREITFTFAEPPDTLSLGQYAGMVREDSPTFIASATVGVRDNECNGSTAGKTFIYRLSDFERDEYGVEVDPFTTPKKNLYLDHFDPAASTSDMGIVVSFAGGSDAVNETVERSRMKLILRRKTMEGESLSEYCGSDGKYFDNVAKFTVHLHDCTDGTVEGVTIKTCDITPDIWDEGATIDNIDIACLKFFNGEGNENSMGIRLDYIKLYTPHWETYYIPDINFHVSGGDYDNVVNHSDSQIRFINITDDFYEGGAIEGMSAQEYIDSPLKYKWKLRHW